MKTIFKVMVAAGAVLAMTPAMASAAVVCNSDGDCWRTKQRHVYKPEFGLRVYGDNHRWKANNGRKYRWREAREGRGYWSKGIWIQF